MTAGVMTADTLSGMSGDRDDNEALSWSGDDDPTLAKPNTLPEGWNVVGNAASTDNADAADSDGRAGDSENLGGPVTMSPTVLVVLGVVGGIFLLYTVGWVITVGRANAAIIGTYNGDPLGGFMFMLGGWLAIVAPAIWMCTTLWLTRDGRQRGRILWLLLGLIVLIPWPLLIGAWR